MQNIEIFFQKQKITISLEKKKHDTFNIFTQSIDGGYMFEPPPRGGSYKYHNLMFWIKIRKLCIPLQTQFYSIKVGYQGVHTAWTCMRDKIQLTSKAKYRD